VKSACEITEVNRRLGVKIDIVVTMNDDDTRRYGERGCYTTYYAELGVENLRYGGFDKTNVKGEEYAAKKMEYVRRWVTMCSDIDAAFLDGEESVSPVRDNVTILFHCYGGVNRSGSALCAFLILRKEHTAKQAIERLVAARPGNDYWKKRGYFIDGLIEIDWRSRSRCLHYLTSSYRTSAASHRSSAPLPWSPLDIDSDAELHGVRTGARRRNWIDPSPLVPLHMHLEEHEPSDDEAGGLGGGSGCVGQLSPPSLYPSRPWRPAESAFALVSCWGDFRSSSSLSQPLRHPAVHEEELDDGTLSC